MSDNISQNRVLQVFGIMDQGGAESLIINVFRRIDKSKVCFDFIVHQNKKALFDNEIQELGGKIFVCPTYRVYNHLSYCKWWGQFFKEHPEYKIIHSHVRSTASIILYIAKRSKLIAISHSHSISNGKTLKAFIKNLMQIPLRYIADYFIACSFDAGRWLFGERVISSSKFQIWNNGIDANLFTFDIKRRERMRASLGLSAKNVVGHVGRFVPEKNHNFIINIFNSYIKNHKDSILLLVGDGPLFQVVKQRVDDLGLTDNVIFAGQQEDIPSYLDCMDHFLFPSLYEGLGIAIIEAQASGLPCVVSDTIPRDVNVSNQVEFVPLAAGTDNWITALEAKAPIVDRRIAIDKIVSAGYDIDSMIVRIQDFYLGITSE